jgi:hypothetical protein
MTDSNERISKDKADSRTSFIIFLLPIQFRLSSLICTESLLPYCVLCSGDSLNDESIAAKGYSEYFAFSPTVSTL